MCVFNAAAVYGRYQSAERNQGIFLEKQSSGFKCQVSLSDMQGKVVRRYWGWHNVKDNTRTVMISEHLVVAQ